MLHINNKEYNVLSSNIKFVNSTYNRIKGYSVLIFLDIELNNARGYISFYVDFFDTKDFKHIENRKYVELPTELDSKITMIEIFDTINFIDFIDSKINLKFGSINNNQIKIYININDNLIKLDYKGLLNIT